MDGIRGEVSNKIRSAIKAKLMELGAYVDDELPDYIMVMVANKRSRQQMEDDLQLFLGDSTSTFTTWLHTVLSKLQQVTVNSAEIKKNADKKRLLSSSEDHKKEKKKKLKKEKEKLEKSPDKGKEKEKNAERGDESRKTVFQLLTHQIKSEPVDLVAYEDSLLNDGQAQQGSQPSTSMQSKKASELRINEEEEDDDFINLKADVEADMWGEADEASTLAAKSSNKSQSMGASASDSRPLETRSENVQIQKPDQPNLVSELTSSLSLEAALSNNGSTSKQTAEPQPAPRIIRISETIREEQESLKPSSRNARDLQASAKRVFQSHIVSLKRDQEKSHNRNTSSRLSNNNSRKIEYKNNRSHDNQDLRQSLRKEHQRERDRGRERERERRRSRDRNQSRTSHGALSSVVRSSLSHKSERDPDSSLSSVVRVKPRPQIPAALQANRSLILKAVAEAQKSVSKVVVRPEPALRTSLARPKLKRPAKTKMHIGKDQETAKIQTLPKKDLQKPSTRLPSREKLKKLSFTVIGEQAALLKDSSTADVCDGSDEGSIILDPSLNILIQVPASPAEECLDPPDPIQAEKVRRWIKDVEEATKSEKEVSGINFRGNVEVDADSFAGVDATMKHLSDDAEEFEDGLDADTNSFKTSDIHSVVISEDQPCRQVSGTQFVVTLDGLDPRLLRSFALEGDGPTVSLDQQEVKTLPVEQNSESQEILLREELIKEQILRQELLKQQAAVREQKTFRRPTIAVSPVPALVNPQVKRPASPSSSLEVRPLKVVSALPKSSSAERCKFWPSCKNGDKCEFHHPSVPCKLFPNCKFADRCLYIHPNCRFNTACTRTDCPYTHTGPRTVQNTPPSGSSQPGCLTIKQACKFFPNCSNLSCPYIHPTVCKFGTHCTKPKCQFIHSDKGLITKHKWVRH